MKAVEVAFDEVVVEIVKSGAVLEERPAMENLPQGVVVPMPRLPSNERRLETVRLLEVMEVKPDNEVMSELEPETAGTETVQLGSVGPQSGVRVWPG